jgi:hypothetical protein
MRIRVRYGRRRFMPALVRAAVWVVLALSLALFIKEMV